MKNERFVIIGGVAAGMSAASRARVLRPEMEILVFERNGYISHIGCGMPYLISDIVKSSGSLLVYSPQFFKEKRNIDVYLHHEVKEISPQRNRVLVRDGQTGEEREYSYDKLLISTGARPVVPPVDGRDLKGVFTLRRHEDGIAVKDYINKHYPRNGLVLGAGYIGMEVAESFSETGMKVIVVEKMPSILGTMDDEINEMVEEELKTHGVVLVKSKAVMKFTGEGGSVAKAILEGGESIDVDIALIGAGIRPNSEIAKEAGVELGQAGAIRINSQMETNVPDIYAAGDCAEAYHLVLGRNVYIPLGTTANKQGKIAGENVAGGNASFAGIVGTAVFKVFDLEVCRTGITEKEARAEGINYISNIVEHTSKAHYYPGVSVIRIKLVADKKTGRLLGAQMVGAEGVSKRIDVFATALTARMTAQEIASLDLGYAPPFAPVYDPILIAAEQLDKRIPKDSAEFPVGRVT
jgi:NADPH-dependent 2,4-dienoyl-CoA reductase/sulfur reductase-like enzyme